MDKPNIPLTSAEMSGLWTQYMNDTLGICVGSYYLEKVEDPEIRPIIEYTVESAQTNISEIEDVFNNHRFPIPVGFTENDVNPKAAKLFSDYFYLFYYKNMSTLGMAANSASIGLATNPEVIQLHKRILKRAINLQDKCRDLMLKKEIYIKPPTIPVPIKSDFVKQQGFLAGYFGKQRNLTSIELTHLSLNIQTNSIGNVLISGFAQIAKDEKVRDYLLKGKQISQKHLDIFSNILIKEHLPAPLSGSYSLLNTTESPFSDKLMMFHISAMIAAGIGNYGTAIAATLRRDIAITYAQLIPEITLYAEDGANIMIKNGWMEEPPLTQTKK